MDSQTPLHDAVEEINGIGFSLKPIDSTPVMLQDTEPAPKTSLGEERESQFSELIMEEMGRDLSGEGLTGSRVVAQTTLEDLRARDPKTAAKYDRLDINGRLKFDQNRTLPNPRNDSVPLILRTELFDITKGSEDLNLILGSGVHSVEKQIHWTSDDRCLVLLHWTAPKTWIDPRAKKSQTRENDASE